MITAIVDAVERSRAARYTGLGRLISFYRYFSFNLPRATTGVGVTLLLGVAAVRLYWLAGGFVVSYPAYLAGYFAVVAALAFLAAALMVVPRPWLAATGWAVGSVVCVATVAVYVATRTAALPGLPQLVGRWDYALGTFAMVLAALFVVLHVSVLTKVNVAHPGRRQWHD